MALTAKERERIIEEETLRYETQLNLRKKYCAERPVRWPWFLLGLLLLFFVARHLFCPYGSCDSMRGYHGCPYSHSWSQDQEGEPGQPVAPSHAPQQ